MVFMNKIIPAILATDISDLELKVAQIPDEVKLVHIDILEKDIYTDIDIDFEAHIMTKEPDKFASLWVERGAKGVIVHKLSENILHLKNRTKLGLGIEFNVPLEEMLPSIAKVDFIHLMSITQMGEQGHPFESGIFDRIKKVREKFPQVEISVDGGINTDNYQKLLDLGVNKLVVGSGFKKLWNSLTKK